MMISEALKTRTVTGLVLAVGTALLLILAATTCSGRLILGLVGVLLAGGCALEYSRMARDGGASRFAHFFRLIALIVPALLVFLGSTRALSTCESIITASSLAWLNALGYDFAILLSVLMVFLAGRTSLKDAAQVAQSFLPAMILIGLGSVSLVAITALTNSWAYLAWLIAVVCCNDIAAYFVGSKIGGPKLCLAISPNKTISGSVGGLIAGVVAGLLLAFLISPRSLVLVGALSALVVFSAQCGDLTKSYLKRHYGVKDSGAIFPGHGGLLDRLDGILMAAPIMWAWLLSF